MAHHTKLLGFFLSSLLIFQLVLHTSADPQQLETEGTAVSSRRNVLADSPTCKKISDNLRHLTKLAASKPMFNLPLSFPVFSLDPKLGELSDSCVYSIPVEKWRKESEIPEAYIDAVEILADIAAFNGALAGCQQLQKEAIAMWQDLVLKWAAVKGFTGSNTSWSGVFMSHKALAATAAAFMKVRPSLSQMAKETIVGWLQVWDVFTAGIPVTINGKVFKDSALGQRIIAQYGKGTLTIKDSFTSNPDGGAYNNHELWKQTARLLANLAIKDYKQAKKRLQASIEQMSKQVKNGYIVSERRCLRTVHYHVYYLEAGLISLATWKLSGRALPSTVVPLLPQINKVLKNIESPNAAKILPGFFKYSMNVTKTQVKWTGDSRLRKLFNFVWNRNQKTLGFADQDCRFVGFLANLKI